MSCDTGLGGPCAAGTVQCQGGALACLQGQQAAASDSACQRKGVLCGPTTNSCAQPVANCGFCPAGETCDGSGACVSTTTTTTTPPPVDECALGTDGCDANATCIDTPDNYTCACNDGFVGDGFTCVPEPTTTITTTTAAPACPDGQRLVANGTCRTICGDSTCDPVTEYCCLRASGLGCCTATAGGGGEGGGVRG